MSVYVPAVTRRVVRERAADRCEYCRIVQAVERRRFEIDHVRPLRHGGRTVAANLALACPSCNLWKGPNVAAFDPADDRLATLFNPRVDVWADHFEATRGLASGLTPAGRATVAFLKMNDPLRVRLRTTSFRLAGGR